MSSCDVSRGGPRSLLVPLCHFQPPPQVCGEPVRLCRSCRPGHCGAVAWAGWLQEAAAPEGRVWITAGEGLAGAQALRRRPLPELGRRHRQLAGCRPAWALRGACRVFPLRDRWTSSAIDREPGEKERPLAARTVHLLVKTQRVCRQTSLCGPCRRHQGWPGSRLTPAVCGAQPACGTGLPDGCRRWD